MDLVNWFAYVNSQEMKYDEKNFVKIADLLLSNGANFTGEYLYFIVAGGCNQLVEYYLKKGLPIDVKLEGKSMIEIATETGNQDLVDILVNYGAQAIRAQKAYTLQLIEELSGLSEINKPKVEELLSKGADINGRDANGTTPLGALVRNPEILSNSSHIVYLLNKGADPNLQYDPKFQGLPQKTYPLNIVIMWCGRTIGANKRSRKQQKAINSEFKAVLESMLKSGFRIAAKDEDMRTPLHYAAIYDFPFGVELLLENGAKKSDKDKDGMTPYDLAESSKVIQLLE